MFYNNFINFCNARNVKPTPLLKQLGISTSSLDNWKKGGGISAENLQKLAVFFNVSMDFLYSGAQNSGNIVHADNIANGDNNSAVVTITTDSNKILALTEYEKELFRLYSALNVKNKSTLLSQAYKLEEQQKNELESKE